MVEKSHIKAIQYLKQKPKSKKTMGGFRRYKNLYLFGSEEDDGDDDEDGGNEMKIEQRDCTHTHTHTHTQSLASISLKESSFLKMKKKNKVDTHFTYSSPQHFCHDCFSLRKEECFDFVLPSTLTHTPPNSLFMYLFIIFLAKLSHQV